MGRPSGRIHELEHHAADRSTTRPVVSGTQGVVAAGHPLVSMAGMRMLLSGGNAFDAAVAAGFAAAVVEPTASYTLCGECVALIHDARARQSLAVSGQGTAPALATIGFFRGRGLDRIPTGPGPDAHLSFTVPGAVDAYLTVLEAHGTKTVSEVLAPALQYAEHGFPMYEHMRRVLAVPETQSQFDVYPPGGTAVFYPGGRAPEVGELFVQAALGGTLRRLVEADTGARGHRTAGIAAARARFYRGDLAAAIGAFSERWGDSCALPIGGVSGPARAAAADDLRGPGDSRTVGVDAGARAHAGPGHARGLRSSGARAQLRAVHPRGDGGAQAGVRRPRAALRRLARTRSRRSARCSRRRTFESGRRSSAWTAPRPRRRRRAIRTTATAPREAGPRRRAPEAPRPERWPTARRTWRPSTATAT